MAQTMKSGVYKSDASTDIATSLDGVPVTKARKPYTEWQNIQQPGVARVNLAVTEESPEGSKEPGDYSAGHAHQTVLQQHCDFFDLNRDGVITPLETYIGFRLLQWGVLLSLLATAVIHGGFSWFSLPPGRWLPDPLFRVFLANVHGAKHGSDTGTYDHEGRFRAQNFADFFAKYGSKLADGTFGITYAQALHGTRRQRCVMDPFGVSAEFFEWTATWLTIWPADGIMHMEDVRAVYDGSYFYKTAGHRREAYLRKSWLY